MAFIFELRWIQFGIVSFGASTGCGTGHPNGCRSHCFIFHIISHCNVAPVVTLLSHCFSLFHCSHCWPSFILKSSLSSLSTSPDPHKWTQIVIVIISMIIFMIISILIIFRYSRITEYLDFIGDTVGTTYD